MTSTAYFVCEGLHGCFKDRVLCGVQYEPCALRLTVDRDHRQQLAGGALPPGADVDPKHDAQSEGGGGGEEEEEEAGTKPGPGAIHEEHQVPLGYHSPRAAAEEAGGDEMRPIGEGEHFDKGFVDEDAEDAVVMGPSGRAEDVVARVRLPRSLGTGDWLYFSRMGAYTNSIASLASSAAIHATFRYVASTPAAEYAAEPECATDEGPGDGRGVKASVVDDALHDRGGQRNGCVVEGARVSEATVAVSSLDGWGGSGRVGVQEE